MTFYASSYTPPYEETRNRRVKLDLNRLLRVQSMVEIPLISYRDEDIDLSYDPYANEYYSVEMEDELLGSYVNKVVFSTALANGDEIHCVGNCCEGTERMYQEGFNRRETPTLDYGDVDYGRFPFANNDPIINRTPRRNPNKGLRKKKTKKIAEEQLHVSDDTVPIGTSAGIKDGHPMFTASLFHLRDYINSVVEAKVRFIHDSYERQFRMVNKDRMSTLARLIKVKEICATLQKRLDEEEKTIRQYKAMCDRLASQVEVGKEAKRRRRHARKLKKTDLIVSSFDETGDESQGDSKLDMKDSETDMRDSKSDMRDGEPDMRDIKLDMGDSKPDMRDRKQDMRDSGLDMKSVRSYVEKE